MELELFFIMTREVISRFNRGQRLTPEEKAVCLQIIKNLAVVTLDSARSIKN